MGQVLGLGAMTGTAGGAGGTGFSAPQGADIVNPISQQQETDAQTDVTATRDSQNALLTALQGQNGLANQNQVYNQQQGIVNGTGPNPAQAMLNQSTGQNVANQASLMAGQRGASSNVGLLARLAAQQGASTQQQAVGQGATLQANQSLNALNNAGNMANTQAANQIGQTNTNNAAAQNHQQSVFGAIQGANNSQVGMQSNMNNVNGQLANTQLQGQQALSGGLMNGAGLFGGLPGKPMGADGGEVVDTSTPAFGSDSGTAAFAQSSGGPMKMLPMLGMLAAADGGDVSAFPGPQSRFGQYLAQANNSSSPDTSTPTFAADSATKAFEQKESKGAPKPGDKTDSSGAAPDPGGVATAGGGDDLAGGAGAATTLVAAMGGMTSDYRRGGHVKAKNPSQKAVVSGNSYANDKIPAVLSEGEVVIPRNVMNAKDPVSASAQFVQAVIQKRRMRG